MLPPYHVKVMMTVLFACVHNAGRSQMASAWFNRLADSTKARAMSAGTNPAGGVHPEVVEVMSEVGIDLSGAPTSRLTPELARQAHLLVTMGCGDQCPVVPGLTRDDWPLADPKGQPLTRVREIRDEIRRRVERLLEQEGWSADPRRSTSTNPPVMCTLTPDALRARQEGLLADLLGRAEGKDFTDEGLRLRFAADSETLSAIARAVDAERRCCRFLRFTVVVEPEGGPMSLELTGPPGTREFLSSFFDE